ncbi:MAG: hypothetical protein R3B57_13705 [Phycisphaerales bacterium]
MDIAHQIVSDEDSLLLVVCLCIACVWIVSSAFTRICTTATRERTKREIAAYIAEGSMSPEQGERIIKAGKKMEC